MQLLPYNISSEDNDLSDCLSRGAMLEFFEALQARLQAWSGGPAALANDKEDWQLKPSIVHEDLEEEFGAFDVDACTDHYRTNAHCTQSWNATDDCTK